jgi:agmatine/peptidylarginine deiminase
LTASRPRAPSTASNSRSSNCPCRVQWSFASQRLPASYANFYIANGLVLVPTFHDPNDRVALNILAEVFPDREVIGIHSVDLVWGLGTLHCMTQQQPAAPRTKT